MVGIGGKKVANKAVTLPINLQWVQKPINMQLYVGDTPKGVGILMGLDIQEPLGTVIVRPASVIRFQIEKNGNILSATRTPPAPSIIQFRGGQH